MTLAWLLLYPGLSLRPPACPLLPDEPGFFSEAVKPGGPGQELRLRFRSASFAGFLAQAAFLFDSAALASTGSIVPWWRALSIGFL
jgi:hypothetical protein